MNNTNNKTRLFLGDNIELLRQLPDNSVDSIVTDAPYGLGQEPNPTEVMQSWITNGYHEISGKGFMGKEWDAFVPQPLFWKEAYRVLKHGGHVLCFFGTRTYDWGVMAMRFAGFEVRDCIQWLYGSGFPKSHNISKAIDKMGGESLDWFIDYVLEVAEEKGITRKDLTMLFPSKNGNPTGWLWNKQNNQSITLEQYNTIKDFLGLPFDNIEEAKREVIGIGKAGLTKGNIANFSGETEFDITAPATDAAKQWDGWGSALKPANEPIVLARKPLEKGLSIAENVLKHSTGGLNIDGCRIGLSNKDVKDNGRIINRNIREGDDGWGMQNKNADKVEVLSSQGRFPANLILTHHPDCECIGTKKVKGQIDKPTNSTQKGNVWNDENSGLRNNLPQNSGGFADENGEETIENWICVDNCPVKLLDEQSGVLNKQGVSKSDNKSGWQNQYVGGNDVNPIERTLYLDTGGASRFFMNFDSGGNDGFFYYIYEEINTKICGNILENQKVVGMLNGVMLEAEKYIQSVEQFMFGNKSMENYQMDAKYTISTLTKQMIELKTCNALQGLNIDFYTEELLKTINSLTILSIEDVNFANCINRFKNLLLELVEHIKGIVNHVKSPYYKNGEKLIEKNTTHTIENIGKDQKHRFFYTAKESKDDRNEGLKGFEVKQTPGGGGGIGNYLEDVNSASGKFGSEKAPSANTHPTVKPTELMRYLCRLITPPNGIVLDPVMGSGSTGKAAIVEGFQFVGMEMEEEYFKIAEARIAKAERDYFDSKRQLNLF